jgi:hypothetical protein
MREGLLVCSLPFLLPLVNSWTLVGSHLLTPSRSSFSWQLAFSQVPDLRFKGPAVTDIRIRMHRGERRRRERGTRLSR